MKSIRITHLRAACAVLLCGVVAFATALATDTATGVTQQLLAPKVSSKVEAVLWTRRGDRYTLQVVFPRPTTGIRIEPIKNNTNVKLWLLKADGTAIPTGPALSPKQGAVTNEVAYSISLSAGEAAVAVALKIEEEYFIEALRPLN